jgi:hypothetical protein
MEKFMSNVAFVLRQALTLTQQRKALEVTLGEDGQLLAGLVHGVSKRVKTFPGQFRTLEYFDLDDLGMVLGLPLYSGEKAYEETLDVILVPDVAALATREDHAYKHHTIDREKAYRLRSVRSLYRADDGEFDYQYPRASAGLDIHGEIISELQKLILQT